MHRPGPGDTSRGLPQLAMSVLGWFTVAISLMTGLLGAAPFTPAIYLVAVLLPVVALLAWHGAMVTGLLSFFLCLLAFAASPLPIKQLVKMPFAVGWLSLCLIAVLAGVVHGLRSRKKRAAQDPQPGSGG